MDVLGLQLSRKHGRRAGFTAEETDLLKITFKEEIAKKLVFTADVRSKLEHPKLQSLKEKYSVEQIKQKVRSLYR